jgi:hypothetical protein
VFKHWKELEDAYYRLDNQMSIMEPPPEGENTTAVLDDEPVAIPDTVPVTGRVEKEVCETCLRPVLEVSIGNWGHWDSRIDHPSNPAFHFAVLRPEERVKWGFLNTPTSQIVAGANNRMDGV